MLALYPAQSQADYLKDMFVGLNWDVKDWNCTKT
jgi:hypothetical protein